MIGQVPRRSRHARSCQTTFVSRQGLAARISWTRTSTASGQLTAEAQAGRGFLPSARRVSDLAAERRPAGGARRSADVGGEKRARERVGPARRARRRRQWQSVPRHAARLGSVGGIRPTPFAGCLPTERTSTSRPPSADPATATASPPCTSRRSRTTSTPRACYSMRARTRGSKRTLSLVAGWLGGALQESGGRRPDRSSARHS